MEDVVELGYGVAAFNADGHLCALFGINWGREIGGSRQEVVLESYHITRQGTGRVGLHVAMPSCVQYR